MAGSNVVASQQLLEEYTAAGKPFKAYSLPLYSSVSLPGKVVASGQPNHALLVFEKNYEATCFNYAQNDQLYIGTVGVTTTKVADVSDTNLTEASKTPANMDFAIEMLAISWQRPRIQYSDPPNGLTEQAVVEAFTGRVPLHDPASIYVPPQMSSPFNLEETLDTALRGNISVDLEWGDSRSRDPLGLADVMHDATAKSFLRAAGLPEHTNGLYQPEGHIWRGTRLGSDAKMTMRFQIEETVVIPINLVTWPGTTGPAVPLRIIAEYKVLLFGLGLLPLGRNA